MSAPQTRPASTGLRAAFGRMAAIFVKEFLQLRRDRGTLGMIVAIPLMQLMLFGFAINTDPKHLPTTLLVHDDGPLARSLVSALRATDYFSIKRAARDAAEADQMIRANEVQFVIEIPPDFDRRLVHGEKPALLLVADATDPVATVGAVAGANGAMTRALSRELVGPLATLAQK